ncbi:hypothetical protein BF49_1331 [Bradyrhizobium sp.]|nr:hypothetical protein BF49_1331 [Bradyrhizobium sp.]
MMIAATAVARPPQAAPTHEDGAHCIAQAGREKGAVLVRKRKSQRFG